MDNGEVRLEDGVVKRLALALGYTDYSPYSDNKYVKEATQVLIGLSLPKKKPESTKWPFPTRKNTLVPIKDIFGKSNAV